MGEARITKGYRLPAKHVIRTVGLIWHGGSKGEGKLLRNCYRNSLRLAEQNVPRTIVSPSISTGAYGFSIDQAARITIETVDEYSGRGLVRPPELELTYVNPWDAGKSSDSYGRGDCNQKYYGRSARVAPENLSGGREPDFLC